MTRSDRPRDAPTPTVSQPPPPPSADRSKRWAFAGYVSIGLAVAAALFVGKLVFERSPSGKRAELETYTMLMNLLPRVDASSQPVVVVSIDHLPGGQYDAASDAHTPTSRADLLQLIRTLRSLGAAAVGIDVDVSPTRRGFVMADDDRFFDACLSLASSMPVSLAIARTIHGPADGWLGLPAYRSLAAAAYLPPGTHERTPIEVTDPAVGAPLPTLGAKVADQWPATHEGLAALTSSVQRFDERDVVDQGRRERLRIKEVLTNYAILPALKDATIRISRADDLRRFREQIEGHMVLLGAVDQATDTFVVPGSSEPVAGVYLHAATAYTLAIAPIWELSHTARIVLDLVLTGGVLALAIRTHVRVADHTRAHASEVRTLRLVCAAIVLAGFALFFFARLMWLDFLVVIVVLALHPVVERYVHARLSRPVESAHMPVTR